MLTITYFTAIVALIVAVIAGGILVFCVAEWLDQRNARRHSLRSRPKAWPVNDSGFPVRRQEDQPKPAEFTKPHSMFDIESLQAARDLREWKP